MVQDFLSNSLEYLEKRSEAAKAAQTISGYKPEINFYNDDREKKKRLEWQTSIDPKSEELYRYNKEFYADKENDLHKKKIGESLDSLLIKNKAPRTRCLKLQRTKQKEIFEEEIRNFYSEIIFFMHSKKFRQSGECLSTESERKSLQPLHRGQVDYFLKSRETPESLIYKNALKGISKRRTGTVLTDNYNIACIDFPNNRREAYISKKNSYREIIDNVKETRRRVSIENSYEAKPSEINPKKLTRHLRKSHKKISKGFEKLKEQGLPVPSQSNQTKNC